MVHFRYSIGGILKVVEYSNIKEYETDKKMWILWQDIRAKERYAEILFRGMSGRGKTS